MMARSGTCYACTDTINPLVFYNWPQLFIWHDMRGTGA
jgi:hypothetical protein